MGLIKAAVGAVSGTMADQWKEFFACDSMPADVLVMKGKNKNSGRSSNKHGEDNVITDGSGISVADGQCAIIVEQGAIVELCAEPGLFTYRTDLAPSIFTGTLKEGLKSAALEAWNRFQFGGGAGKDQRVYYINTKHIMGNKYGTLNPVPFKVIIDKQIGKGLSIGVRCNGEYAYRIVNPMLFYTNVASNVKDVFTRDELDSQLKSELLKALQPALARVSQMGVDYSEIPLYTEVIADGLDEALTKQWTDIRGIAIVSFGVNSVSVSEEDKLKIQNLEQAIMMSDPMIAAGNIVQGQVDAMRDAAKNTAGAMTGFMGMGMAGMQGGMNAQNLFAMGQQQQMQQMQMQQQMAQQAAPAAPAAGGWTCSCGAAANGKFCPECGSPKPVPVPAAAGWTCSCGALNKGKFCAECGSPKPAGAPLYRCDKCGWEPADPSNPPRFCPECGDVFDDNDKVQ